MYSCYLFQPCQEEYENSCHVDEQGYSLCSCFCCANKLFGFQRNNLQKSTAKTSSMENLYCFIECLPALNYRENQDQKGTK